VKFTLAILASVLPALVATPSGSALATTYTLSYLGDPATAYADTENFTVFAPGVQPDGRAGPVGPVWLSVSGSDGTTRLALSYSIDAVNSFSPGSGYTLGYLGGFLADPVKRAQIMTLLVNGTASVHDAVSAAALQTAIWEVEYEASGTAYDIGTGAFQVSAYGGWFDTRVAADTRTYLADLQDGSWAPDPLATPWLFYSTAGNSEAFAAVALDGNSPGIPIPGPAPLLLIAVAAPSVAGLWLRRRYIRKSLGGNQPDPSLTQMATSVAATKNTVR
jgi:hypothetical protein